MADDHQHHDDHQDHGTRRRRRVLQAAISFYSAETTEALWPPLMTLTTKKSPITWVTTKIEPSAMPLLDSGSTISAMTRQRQAPASWPPR